MAPVRIAPLLVTGMHRSGTSALARLLAGAGLDLGDALMAGRLDNPLGYYEDLGFNDLNRALITAGVGGDPRLTPDWAFADRIDPDRLAPLRPRAAALLAEHDGRGRAWGFKDPRTAVLLDFYAELVPDARHLFVYRAPWDVLSSILRTQERTLQGRADVAVRAWQTYNERLLAFRERHPGRTALVHVDAVAHRPTEVLAVAQAQLDGLAPIVLQEAGARDAFDDALLHRDDPSSPLAELLAADHPEALALYARLEASADLAGTPTAVDRFPRDVEVVGTRATTPLSLVLVGGATVGLHDADFLARPTADVPPAVAADAGVDQVPGDLLAVAFETTPGPAAVSAAVDAFRADAELGAVLLAAGGALAPAVPHDPLAAAEPHAGIVLRRGAWLAVRGFAAGRPAPGFEAWTMVAACAARGIPTARIAGALPRVASPPGEADAARQALLERHPALTARRMLVAEAALDVRERELAQAQADRDHLAEQLDAVRSARAWRLAVGWWRVRDRLRRSGTRVLSRR